MSTKELAFDQHAAVAIRQQIWTASVAVAAAIGGKPEEQARDALAIYKASVELARDYGDPLRAAL